MSSRKAFTSQPNAHFLVCCEAGRVNSSIIFNNHSLKDDVRDYSSNAFVLMGTNCGKKN